MDVFTALADPVRRGLLTSLVGGDARVVDLAAERTISRPAVSKHLRVLGEAGLVTAEDRGRERHYRLQPDALGPVHALLTVLTSAPPISDRDLDGLELEVRRASRDQKTAARADRPATEETA